MSEYENVIARLREENGRLSEALEQAQSDKEFVWSLWKRLQVSSPDLTQAISMVVQREKDKSEEKDAKVLQILQLKDKKIEELQTIVTTQSKELTALIQQKADLTENVKRLEADVVTSTERNRNLNTQLMRRENEDEDWRRRMLIGAEKQNLDLSDKIASLQTELTRIKTDNGDLNAENIKLEGRNVAAEREVSRLRNELIETRNRCEKDIQALESEVSQAKLEAVDRQTEAMNAQGEVQKLLSRLEVTQAQFEKQQLLMNKLETVEENKEAILRNKEETHTQVTADLTSMVKRLEKENTRIRGLLSRRARPPKMPKKALSVPHDFDYEEEAEDAELSDLEPIGEDDASPVVDMKYRVKRMERQMRLLEECVSRRDDLIRTLRDSQAVPKSVSPMRRGAYVRQNRCARLRSKSAPMRTGRRCMAQETLQRQLLSTERMMSDLESVVAEKDEELCSVRRTLDARSRKIRNLTSQLRRCQLQISETAISKESDYRFSENHIIEVTNELSHLRNSYNNLVIKNSDLNTEVNQLKNQLRQMETINHRVEACGDIEVREKSRISEELEQSRLKIRLLEDQLCVVNRHNSSTTRNLEQTWECEKQGLKSEIENLATELAAKRVEISGLQRCLRLNNCNNQSRNGSAMADILEHFAEEEEGNEDQHYEPNCRRVHWQGSEDRIPRVNVEELDEVPTREGVPSSDSSRTRTDESQTSSRGGPRMNGGPRNSQTVILMRRLASLQQQLRVLRKSKKQSAAALSSLQLRSSKMAQELELANARGRRLRAALHQAGSSANNNAQESESESSVVSGVVEGDSNRESEWKEMEKRLRGEVVRQTAQIRQLKEEIESRDRLVEELRERTKRLERESSGRKKLVEDWRGKVKTAEESARKDREELEATLQRLKEAREGAERQRVQQDSLKRRLGAVTEEKRRIESEVDKKSRQSTESIQRRQEAEKKAKRAEEKTEEVARRSEAAVDAARSKVAHSQARLSRINRLLLRVVRAMAERSEEAKQIVETAAVTARRLARRSDSDESMRSAREKAASILNISTDDIDDILHPGTANRSVGRTSGAEKEWLRRCERLLGNGGPCDDDEAEALARSCDERLFDLVSITRTALNIAQA